MKSSLKNTSYYVILGFLPLASNFLLAPLFTRYLTPKEYGLIALCTLFQNYLTIFVDLGLKGAFSRYYFRYHRNEKITNALFSTTLLSILIVSLLLFILLFWLGDILFQLIFGNSEFTFHTYGILVFPLTINALINAVILTYFRNTEDIFRYALLSLSTFFLMALGAIVGVVFFQKGAVGNVVGKAIGASVVIIAFLVIYFWKNSVVFSFRLIRPLVKYGYPLIPFALLNITIANIDRFFIERYFDLNILGQYNIAFLISTIPFILLNAFQSSVNPSIIKSMEKLKRENSGSIMADINGNFKLMLLMMGIVLWFIITFSGIFIRFYVGYEYRSVIQYLPILIAAFIPMIYQNMFSVILFFHYQSRLLPLISLATLAVAVLSNLLLIPWLGIFGVAVAVLIKNFAFGYFTKASLIYKGYYSDSLFVFGKYHWLMICVALTALASLILVNLYPHQYHICTFVSGIVSGIFIFAIFKKEFLTAWQQIRSKFYSRFL